MSSKSTRSSSKSRSQTQQGAISGVRRKRKASGPPKVRRVSLRANACATEALYNAAEITGLRKRARLSSLSQSAAHLDDVELDTAWAAAIRGDYVTASDRLLRTARQTHLHPKQKRAKGWTPWRERLLGRRP